MENNNKSLTLTMIEKKQEISNLINSSNLDPIIWHYILKDLLEEIDIVTNNLLQQEKQKQQKESTNAEEPKENK